VGDGGGAEEIGSVENEREPSRSRELLLGVSEDGQRDAEERSLLRYWLAAVW
jgi:hypothetical protein